MSDFRGDLAILIERGGIVMLPLLALSIISLTLIVERIFFWSTLHRPGRVRRLGQLMAALRRGDRALLARLLDGDRSPYGQVSRHLLDHGAQEAVALEAVEAQRTKFDRFMVSLSTIITAAPLLGILGTVIGIIQSFNLLGEQETLSDPSAVSAGIAEALLTTAMGLVVALVTLFPYMVFRAQVERAMRRVESVIAAAQQGAAAAEAEPPRSAADSAADQPSSRPVTAPRSPSAGRPG
ncbi:MAG: MotA/TolQ/ExbB proton channel family protein [Planctomycetota bacterium]